jgi:aerobic C4-dicarboxylate transport protein
VTRSARTASPALLLLAVLLGIAFGAWSPTRLAWLGAAAQGAIALLNMVGLPMLVICVWSGLRQWPAQSRALPRLAWLIGGGLLGLPLVAGLGGAFAMWVAAGADLGSHDAALLGGRALEVEPIPSVILLGETSLQMPSLPWDWKVPDNLYRALAYETLVSALTGVAFLGLGLAAQDPERSRAFTGLMQGIYRSLEVLIERLLVWLPFLVFALTASAVHALGLDFLARMQSFLLPCALAVLSVTVSAVAVTSVRLGLPLTRVLGAVHESIVLCLFSTGPSAAVPCLIDGVCNRLGFRRDLMDLAAPMLPVFLRLGDALFFGVLVVFTANLYDRPLNTLDLPLVAGASALAALACVVLSSGWVLATGGLMLAWFELPFEALLPTFVLLEVLTAGWRNLVSVIVVVPLAALVAGDLMTSKAADPDPQQAAVSRVTVSLSAPRALALASLLAFACLVAALAGIGVGLGDAAMPRPAASVPRPEPITVSTP